ncbi:hypothetical protein [Noviherbaspirillum autotrophicum]|uniref:Uncharacterized protein n=1 Tax=Noviherbaspirillum autotrophicum TaxID=709839 RepID=A0A0C2BHH5_9BURK|nr:hypothetical protein [Noviherbaspirillum autotrophicum]KIF80700.1 hypothetical protein TSA66_07565 [Noviherbaspirillum autotrophicum]
MQIETIGKYQLHLIAHELPGTRGWHPYVSIHKFDDAAQDFICVLDKHHAGDEALPSYDEAIDMARRVGTALLEKGNL